MRCSAFRLPRSAFSYARTAPRVEIVLQQDRRRQRVHAVLPAPGGAPHVSHRVEGARGREPLVPQGHGLAGVLRDRRRQRAGGAGGVTFSAVRVERQADHHARHGVTLDQGEQLTHGEAPAGTAREGRERLGERLRLVGQCEADAALSPVHAEQPPRPAGHPCCIVWKNSTLFFVRFMRSSRNSMPSTGGMSARKLRSRYTLLSSSFVRSSSSLRVPERCTSMDGNVRRSAIRRSRITSMLPVPLNSSKITSSMREPVSMSAVPTMVSEPPPSILRAAPKNRLGFCSAFASTPPDRILPEWGTTTLCARPMRVIESSRITTSLPCSTRRLAFSITMSAT